MRKNSMIFVTFQKEGIHKFPAALTDLSLDDVKFLGYEHRHMFHFKVWIDVFHDDREIEFIQFKRWLESLFSNSGPMLMNYQSCEMLSDSLYDQIIKKYPNRNVWIQIAEDNENGSFIKYTLD